jgi:hypothetical protein
MLIAGAPAVIVIQAPEPASVYLPQLRRLKPDDELFSAGDIERELRSKCRYAIHLSVRHVCLQPEAKHAT